MATRHVWEKFDKKAEYTSEVSTQASRVDFFDTSGTDGTSVILAASADFDKNTGIYTLRGSTTTMSSGGTSKSGVYLYGMPGTRAETKTDSTVWYNAYGREYWYLYKTGTSSNSTGTITMVDDITNPSSTSSWKTFQVLGSELTYVKGPSIGYASYDQNSRYPSDGASGDYFYKYMGSDNIDPISVAYSKNADLEPGDVITVTLEPSTSNLYGGTIYYQYVYSIDGSHTSVPIGEKTTNTSITVKVPENAEQFMVYVKASDDWGFTSYTNVFGANLEVSNGHLYVGVGGVARKAQKLYVGVNGTARKVKRGYIGVNGVARQFYSG